jgi:hypothetical protein
MKMEFQMRFTLIASLAMVLACSNSEEGAANTPGEKGDKQQAAGKAPAAGDASAGPVTDEGNQHGSPDGHHSGPIEFAAAPGNAKVSFSEPADGAVVSSPVHAEFHVENMTVAPADGAVLANQGHHHVIVDGSAIDERTEVPKNETHIHYGAGQIEADLKLAPGAHTLTLQFADGRHRSYGSRLSSTIHITVEGEVEAAATDGEAAAEDPALTPGAPVGNPNGGQ